jgi:hypothetical protein
MQLEQLHRRVLPRQLEGQQMHLQHAVRLEQLHQRPLSVTIPGIDRVSGAYLERADDSRLLFTMTHGPNMPSAMTVRGDLLVQSGLHDTFAPSALSLWDLRTGAILKRLPRRETSAG